jgi:hypothetical protein
MTYTPALTYPALIALDSPVNGWPCQDAAGSSSIADIYGSQPLSTLTNVTLGVTTNPLYPGCTSFHTSGASNDGAVSATHGALTTYAAMTAEIWVYLPAAAAMSSMCLSVGRNSVQGEGFAIAFGNTTSVDTSSTANYVTFLKCNLAWGLGSGMGLTVDPTPNTAAIIRAMIPAGWHHLCWRTEQISPKQVEIFLDGTLVGTFSNSTVSGGWIDHTTNERTAIGNVEVGTEGPNSASTLFAHAYVYSKRLSMGAIRSRSELVKTLSTL